jgi:hypothetical protein
VDKIGRLSEFLSLNPSKATENSHFPTIFVPQTGMISLISVKPSATLISQVRIFAICCALCKLDPQGAKPGIYSRVEWALLHV